MTARREKRTYLCACVGLDLLDHPSLLPYEEAHQVGGTSHADGLNMERGKGRGKVKQIWVAVCCFHVEVAGKRRTSSEIKDHSSPSLPSSLPPYPPPPLHESNSAMSFESSAPAHLPTPPVFAVAVDLDVAVISPSFPPSLLPILYMMALRLVAANFGRRRKGGTSVGSRKTKEKEKDG